MLLYIMLYIVLAYLMLFADVTNAVCLNNASSFFHFFFSLICANAFYFHALSLFISFFNWHHAQCYNLFVFPNYMFTSLLLLFFCFFLNIFYERAMSSPEK